MKAGATIGTMVLAAWASAQGPAAPARLLGDAGIFFGANNYPPEAAAARAQGRVVARLAIDPAGRVTDCTIETSSGSAALDAATCRIATTRLSFQAACDGRGQGVATTYRLPIRWVLPQASGEPIVSLAMTLTATIGPDRQVRECAGAINGRRIAVTPASCASYPALFARALAASPAGIVARMERRQLYAGDPPVAATPPATAQLEETTVRFGIDAQGRAVDCRTARRSREVVMPTADPCLSRTRFAVAGSGRTTFPVAATWISTLSYDRMMP